MKVEVEPLSRRCRGAAKGALLLLVIGVVGVSVIGAAVLVLRSPGGDLPPETRLPEQTASRPAASDRDPRDGARDRVELPPITPTKKDESDEETDDDKDSLEREVVSGARPIRGRRASPTAIHQLGGRVVDAITKQPVMLFTVHCLPASGGDPMEQIRQGRRSGQTFRANDGRFRISSLEKGTYSMVVDAPDFKKWTREGIVVPDNADVEVELSPGSFIDGKLTDLSGRPVGGVSVFLNVISCEDPKQQPKIRIRKTNPQGYYKFSDLPNGVFSVSLEKEKNPEPQLTSQPYSVFQDQHVAHDFTMPLRNTLVFTISDERGVMLNLARIHLYDREGHTFNGTTDLNGEAQIPYVPDGEYTLKVTCRGYQQLQESKVPIVGGAATIPVRRMMRKES